MMSNDGVQTADLYTMEDFLKTEKIDAHVHVNCEQPAFVEQAAADNFRLVSLNIDHGEFPPIDRQLQIACRLRERYPGRLAFAATFRMNGWDAADWPARTSPRLCGPRGRGGESVEKYRDGFS